MAQAAPTVEVAKLEDVEALADIYRDAFSDDYMLSLFPDKDNAGRQFVITSYTNFINRANTLKEGVRPSIAVVRDETGNPLGCAAYHIVPEGFTAEDLGDWRSRWTEPVPGMDAKLLDGFYGGMASQHHNVTKDKPHIFLEVLMVHSAARKRGYGKALLQYGNELGNKLGLPCYLDAVPTAVGIYESVGYKPQRDLSVIDQAVPMWRPVSPAK